MFILRLLLIFFLTYLTFRVLKIILSFPPKKQEDSVSFPKNSNILEDEMVKDPICNTYITKKGAITTRMNGKTFYFCSKECREKFMERG